MEKVSLKSSYFLLEVYSDAERSKVFSEYNKEIGIKQNLINYTKYLVYRNEYSFVSDEEVGNFSIYSIYIMYLKKFSIEDMVDYIKEINNTIFSVTGNSTMYYFRFYGFNLLFSLILQDKGTYYDTFKFIFDLFECIYNNRNDIDNYEETFENYIDKVGLQSMKDGLYNFINLIRFIVGIDYECFYLNIPDTSNKSIEERRDEYNSKRFKNIIDYISSEIDPSVYNQDYDPTNYSYGIGIPIQYLLEEDLIVVREFLKLNENEIKRDKEILKFIIETIDIELKYRCEKGF